MRHSLLVLALLTGCAPSEPSSPVDQAPAIDAVVDTAPADTAPADAAPADPPAAPSDPAAAAPGTWAHYGAAFTAADSTIIPASRLFAETASFVDQNVLVEGTVVDVCQKAGCWMVITEGDQQIRVTMKEHGFAVDKQGTGARARIEGVLKSEEMPADTVAHIEGESAHPELMPEKKGVKLQLIATGVALMKPKSEG